MSIPTVSVVIPAYNVEKYLKYALVSLEKQSFVNFEALIVDDGSTDRTPEIARSWEVRDARFKLLQKVNGGLSSARNYGINYASGKYIGMLDGDDLYGADKLATHVKVLDSFSNVGVVYSASRAINDDGSHTLVSLSGKPIKSDPLQSLLCKNFIGHGSNAVFRRCIFDEVGNFDESLKSCEDIDYWLRVAATKNWDFYRIPSIKSFYRVRPSGLSFDVREMQNAQIRAIDNAYRRSPELSKSILYTAYAYTYRYLARLSLTSGDANTANEFIERALSSDASIFLRDWRSLLTLLSVKLAPLSQLAIKKILAAK